SCASTTSNMHNACTCTCTLHITTHMSTHPTARPTKCAKASCARRNCRQTEKLRPASREARGGPALGNVAERTLAPRAAAAYDRPMLNLGRREFLKLGGGLAVAGFAPALLAWETRGHARSCFLVSLLGGPPHLDMFDLKPNAPAEVRGP